MSETSRRPLFVVVEGPDGSGKSSFAASLLDEMHRRGEQATLLKTPSDYFTGQNARMAIEGDGNPIPETWPLLFAADMINLYHIDIARLLREGTTVIVDRWLPSTLIYQRVTMKQRGWAPQSINQAESNLEHYFESLAYDRPDIHIYVHAPTDVRVARLKKRHHAELKAADGDWSPDWYEKQSSSFHRQVGLMYDNHYRQWQYPGEVIKVNGTEQWTDEEFQGLLQRFAIQFPTWSAVTYA